MAGGSTGLYEHEYDLKKNPMQVRIRDLSLCIGQCKYVLFGQRFEYIYVNSV